MWEDGVWRGRGWERETPSADGRAPSSCCASWWCLSPPPERGRPGTSCPPPRRAPPGQRAVSEERGGQRGRRRRGWREARTEEPLRAGGRGRSAPCPASSPRQSPPAAAWSRVLLPRLDLPRANRNRRQRPRHRRLRPVRCLRLHLHLSSPCLSSPCLHLHLHLSSPCLSSPCLHLHLHRLPSRCHSWTLCRGGGVRGGRGGGRHASRDEGGVS